VGRVATVERPSGVEDEWSVRERRESSVITMASLKDTASFFAEGSASQFEHVLSLYPQALKLKAERKNKKPEELIKLDDW
jgi:hypothetical protein